MTRSHRSFRIRLAVRIAAALGAIVILASVAGYVALRSTLYERLDAILERLATIEAAATADSPDESVHFHDEVFVGTGNGHDPVFVRYAEVWTLDGESVVRTTNLGARHLPLPAAVRRRVAQATRTELFTVTFEGQRFRSLLYPLGLVGPQHRTHLLQVATPTEETEATMRRLAALLAILVVGGVVIGGGLGWWLAGFAVRPVLAIIREAEVMDAAQHGHRIAVEADSAELRRLVAVLNGMLGRIDVLLEGQRTFLADAGHAIKTPITVLRGDIDVALRKTRPSEEYRTVLEQSSADLREVSMLAEDLITLARSDSGALAAPPARVPLDGLLRGIERRFGSAAARAGVVLAVDATTGLEVDTDEALLERALGNVVDNAVKYAGRGARVQVLARAGASSGVELSVRDNGRGLHAEDHRRVFERFYRGDAGRAAAAGSGLGLAIARAIVERFGGTVELRSESGDGTTVLFRLRTPTERSG